MVDPSYLRRVILLQHLLCSSTGGSARHIISAFNRRQSHYSTEAISLHKRPQNNDNDNDDDNNKRGKWFTLPPFTSRINGSALGKQLAGSRVLPVETTALKWILQCCPKLPRSLIQKLFRLRQVRRESSTVESYDNGGQIKGRKLKRVAAKDSLNFGDQIFLPITIQEFHSQKKDCPCTEEEVNFIHSLELYKDPAIVVVNKPPGMPVQGGIGIKRSLDELAAACLTYDYSEPPRLVHRLDRDSSGILVMGRTQTSATVLHSIFREKTVGASKDDIDNEQRILQRWYWALVIGSPRRPNGLISAPLGKVVVDNGKSERITVAKNTQMMSLQHAITEYRVIESSQGYTWLELSPLTGRKHQLRVHCAEVLGTPIVGDHKYGWQAHRKRKQFHPSDFVKNSNEKLPKEKTLPFGLELENGSITGKHPLLHLHCKKMVLPNVSQALQTAQSSSDCNFLELESLKLIAPLPSHMQRSWDLLNS